MKAETKALENGEDTSRTVPPQSARSMKSTGRMSSARSHSSTASGIRKGPQIPTTNKPLPRPTWEPPPWKGSDKHPTDTMR